MPIADGRDSQTIYGDGRCPACGKPWDDHGHTGYKTEASKCSSVLGAPVSPGAPQ